MLCHHNITLISEIAVAQAERDAYSAHCTIAQRDATDTRKQLDQYKQKNHTLQHICPVPNRQPGGKILTMSTVNLTRASERHG